MAEVELKPLDAAPAAEAHPLERPKLDRHDSLSEYDIPREHGATPVTYIKMIHSHPVTACSSVCCLIFFWVVMCFAFGAISADKLTDVGLGMPNEYWSLRSEALYVAQDTANFTVDVANACNRSSPDFAINLVWTREGENLLTEAKLAWFAAEVATFSTGWSRWSDFCYVSYEESSSSSCVAEVDTSMSDADGCYYPQSALSFLDPERDGTYDVSTETLTALAGDSTFLNLVGKDFSASSLSTNILQAYIWLGTPNALGNDYEIDEDCVDCYIEDPMLAFVLEEYSEAFETKLEDSELLFNYNGYVGFPSSLVLQDLSLCIVSLMLVFVYMWWYTGSLWITLSAFGLIFGSFFSTAFFYRYAFPNADGWGLAYFNLFNALAVFIIVGIAADDVFVFVDTWNESAGENFPNITERMSYTYRSAGKAMLITSVTTAVSFFTNLGSTFVGIRAFGAFAGLLIIINYVFLMLLMPAVMHLYHTHWQFKTNYCCVCVRKMTGLCGRLRRRQLKPEDEAQGGAAEEAAAHEGAENPAIAWFTDVYAPFLQKRKVPVTAAFVVVLIVFLVFAVQVEGVPLVVHELLPPGYNFRDYGDAKAYDFPTSANPMLVSVVWGLDAQAGLLDRGDAKAYEIEWGEADVQWDASFRLSDPSYQMGFFTTAEQLALNGNASADGGAWYNSKLRIKNRGINPDYSAAEAADPNAFNQGGVQCFMSEFRDWELAGTSYDADSNTFSMLNDWREPAACRNCWNSTQAVGDTWPWGGGSEGGLSGVPFAERDSDYWWPTALYNMSAINPGCNCFGVWPVPTVYCPQEVEYLPEGDRFRCTSSQTNFLEELGGWLSDVGVWGRWKPYLYATPELANGIETGNADRFALAIITVELNINDDFDDYEAGLEMADAWKAWVDEYNEGVEEFDPLAPKPIVVIHGASAWALVEDLFSSAFAGIFLGLFLAWVVLVFASGNFIMASLAVLNILCVVVCILGFLVMSDWQLGPLESICCVLVVGFSVDYTVHLADSYMESTGASRYEKTRDALGSTGVSVASGAISTILAAAPMLGTSISFFFRFGVFLFLTVCLSITFALGLFVCVLMFLGPEGHAGSLSHMYTPYLERTYVAALEKERKEKTALEQLRKKVSA